MNSWKTSNIIRRYDNSYVIPYAGFPEYHVPNAGEWAALWAEIDAYTREHPEQVTDEPSPPEPTLDEMKAAKLVEINSTYEAAASTLIYTYPQTELLTFDKQESEARAWVADNNVQTPLVDMLALGRQMDKADLVQRILAKADAFALVTGYLTGQRQRYEDMLKIAETAEDVSAIVPEYTLPDPSQGAATITKRPAEELTTAIETPKHEKPADTEASA